MIYPQQACTREWYNSFPRTHFGANLSCNSDVGAITGLRVLELVKIHKSRVRLYNTYTKSRSFTYHIIYPNQ